MPKFRPNPAIPSRMFPKKWFGVFAMRESGPLWCLSP